jgi:hypothetical protein
MTTLYWKWEDEEADGEGVGPVWIIHDAHGDTPGREENWDQWVRRSEAERYASEHDYQFDPDA